MRNSNSRDRKTILTWALAGVFSIMGILTVLVGINILGFLFLSGLPSYNSAQGLGTQLFYLSFLGSPLGGFYWVIWGALATTSDDGGPGALISWAVFLGIVVGITALMGVLAI